MFLQKIKDRLAKDKKIILASLAAGFVFTVFAGASTKVYSDTMQKGIADEVIRFHVLANSDRDDDQALKLKVRDGVLEKYRTELEKCQSIDDTRNVLIENMEGIVERAEEIIEEQGYDYKVTACLSRDMFPTKSYGDVSFPAGEYEALRIVIGDGKGKNWWCVMFPPLCFVDVTHKEIPVDSKQQLKNILTDEEYGVVIKDSKEGSVPFKVKFKIIEWWESL